MSYPRIMLFGKVGQVGAALQPHLLTRGSVIAHDRSTCDLTSTEQLRSAIRRGLPDVIVNAAAYTQVDAAEDDKEACFQINSAAPRTIVEEAANVGAHVIHFSTDYVFDGRKATAYTEDDNPAPLNVYGRSKLAGDRAVLAYDKAIVLRVSWVFSHKGNNFAKTILRLAAERDQLRVVADQYGAPTSAELIARMTARVIDAVLAAQHGNSRPPSGLFNLAPSGLTSWHAYAVHLVDQGKRLGLNMRLTGDDVIAIPTAHYPTAAPRPKNSGLDASKFEKTFEVSLPDWQAGVSDLLLQLTNQRQ